MKGKDQVAKFITNVTEKLKRISPNSELKIKVIKNMPAFVIGINGATAIEIMFEFNENKVANIYAQGNPRKLKNIFL